MKKEGRRVSVRLSLATVGFEDGARGRWPRNAGGLEAGKGQGMASPLELPEGRQPCRWLDFSPVRPAWDF